jgi:hypothetical protein
MHLRVPDQPSPIYHGRDGAAAEGTIDDMNNHLDDNDDDLDRDDELDDLDESDLDDLDDLDDDDDETLSLRSSCSSSRTAHCRSSNYSMLRDCRSVGFDAASAPCPGTSKDDTLNEKCGDRRERENTSKTTTKTHETTLFFIIFRRGRR